MFDVGPLPTEFPGLGQLRCAIAGRLFQTLNSAGFNTHYISHDVESARMYVKPVNIPMLNLDYGEVAVGTMLPVELLCRRMITKKFLARIKDGGQLKPGQVARLRIEQLLVSGELREMAVMDPPFVECSTKYEDADRYLTDKQAAKLVGEGLWWLKSVCHHYMRALSEFFYTFLRAEGNLLLIDWKGEVALLWNGELMLVDSYSPDEFGLIDPQGQLADKNIIRSYMIAHYPEWYAALEAAKSSFPTDKSKWPPYPPEMVIPKELIDDYIEKTRQVALAIGAIKN